MSNKYYNSAWGVVGLSYSIYTQGMDHLLEKVLYNSNKKSNVSESVKEQLEKISQELNTSKQSNSSPWRATCVRR
jgi:hypothetical protein